MCQEINMVIFSFLKGIYKLQKLTFKMLRPAETWFGQNGQVQILEKKSNLYIHSKVCRIQFQICKNQSKISVNKTRKETESNFK